jgi:hypothetical protein
MKKMPTQREIRNKAAQSKTSKTSKHSASTPSSTHHRQSQRDSFQNLETQLPCKMEQKSPSALTNWVEFKQEIPNTKQQPGTSTEPSQAIMLVEESNKMLLQILENLKKLEAGLKANDHNPRARKFNSKIRAWQTTEELYPLISCNTRLAIPKFPEDVQALEALELEQVQEVLAELGVDHDEVGDRARTILRVEIGLLW